MALDKLPDGTAVIYGLFDPLTTELRYVGKTLYSVKKRLKQHVFHTKNSALKTWIDDLGAHGCRPEIAALEVVDSDEWQDAERFWIAYFRSIGANLLNAHEGGGASVRHSEETLAVVATKRRAWLAIPKNRELLRQKSLDAWADPLKRQRMLSSQRAAITPELREMRSELKRRDWAENPDYRANFAAAQAAVDRSALAKEFWQRPEYRERHAVSNRASNERRSASLKIAWAKRKAGL